MAEQVGGSSHAANILGALSLLIQDRVESAWQSDLGLSPTAAAALVQIDNEPGSSIEAVAGRIGLTHSATVRVIDKLAERGLVEKDRARQDARAQSLKLSKAGKRIVQQLHAAHPVSGLGQVMTGKAEGRKAPEQITLFDSVGFATEDFSALRYVRDQLQATGLYEELDLLADPDEPRDLFGMLERAAMQPAA